MFVQRRMKGVKRQALPACVLKEIDDEVERIAMKYNCSKSWVISTTLADAFSIKKQERYYAPVGRRRTIKTKRRAAA